MIISEVRADDSISNFSDSKPKTVTYKGQSTIQRMRDMEFDDFRSKSSRANILSVQKRF